MVHMKYCENCKNICDVEQCSFCGNEQMRDVKRDDFCFLLECGETFGEMLRSALTDKNIECVLIPFGNGARSALGLNLGNYRVYVPYQHYERSQEILDTLSCDPAPELKQSLLENLEAWHVKSKRTIKKLRKKLGIAENDDVFGYIRDAVTNATKVSDAGLISSCLYGGHYIKVQIGNNTIWFNSVTYELYI